MGNRFIQLVIPASAIGAFVLLASGPVRAQHTERFLLRFNEPGRETSDNTSSCRDILMIKGVESVAPTRGCDAVDAQNAQRVGLDRWLAVEVHIDDSADRIRVVSQLQTIRGIERIEPTIVGEVAADLPDDPFFPNQYALHNTGQRIGNQDGLDDADIDAPEAWAIHSGNGLVTVAVIDTGVDPHADYFDRLLRGWNAIDGSDDVSDACAHGTHMAGIIGATGNNGLGVAGVNWACEILPVKVTDGCVGTAENCADGIIWAADHGASVCNISLAFYSYSRYLEDAVRYAAQRDVVLVAAAGNFEGNVVAWPAQFDDVIAVSATDNRDQLADFSNFGDAIELAAPGRDIYSTFIGGTYTWLSGTSTAAPFVSGAASLLRSFDPSLSNAEVRASLAEYADDLGPPGRDPSFGYGRVNVDRALDAAAHDHFMLRAENVIADQNATLDVVNGESDRMVYFVYSFDGPGAKYVMQLDVTVDLDRPRLIGSAVADDDGRAQIEPFVNSQLRHRAVWLQAAQLGGTTQLIKCMVQ